MGKLALSSCNIDRKSPVDELTRGEVKPWNVLRITSTSLLRAAQSAVWSVGGYNEPSVDDVVRKVKR
jgi:hypothetical protein